MTEQRPITDRSDWLQWRKEDITASVVGALPAFACHPYITPLRLHVEKKGVEFEQSDNTAMRRGRRLEPGIADEVAEQHPQWRIERPRLYLRDPVLRLGATPDYYIHDDPRGLGVLECKSAMPDVYEREWLDGTMAPRWVVLQTLTQMMLAGAAFGVIAITDQFAQEDVTCLPVERDLVQEHEICKAVAAFWDDVAHNRDPQPDFEHDSAAIKLLTRDIAPDSVIDLSGSNELPEMLGRRAVLKELIKEHEVSVAVIDNEIKFRMGKAERAIGLQGWSISYPLIAKKPHWTEPKPYRQLIINPRPTRRNHRA